MSDRLAPSRWTISEARSMTAELRHLATAGSEYDALELFKALTDYLDDLYGGAGFDRLLPADGRAAVGREIERLRGSATGSVLLDDDGVPVDPAVDADPVYDTLLRLDQPVNAPVTLVQGRRLAAELAAVDGWQGELGRALQALYDYLDDLYGGRGAFAELLTPDERAEIARRAPGRWQRAPGR